MSRRVLSIDLETYSDVDIVNCGVYRYVEGDFHILLFAYAFDDEDVQCVDLACGEQLPQEVVNAIFDDSIIKSAWNAQFERTCLSKYFGTQLSPDSWQCTMVWAASLSLPLKLKLAAQVLKTGEQKDDAGERLIRYFSIPCKATKSNGGRTRNLPEHAPDDWKLFKSYCIQDVRTERDIRKRLERFSLLPQEWDYYHMDQRINDRGVLIDKELVQQAIICDMMMSEEMTKRAYELTGLENPNSVSQLKNWLEERGISVDSLGKKDVASLIADLNKYSIDSEALDMMKLRLQMAKSSVKKYQAAERCICEDGRVHGLFQFYGANRTGRFAGRLEKCRAGSVDLILTKSISRFARNTVTLLETVRELKDLGVDVYFEEQNIHSLSADGELMLTILASYAQEESRSASENRKWQIRKDFKEGKIGSITIFGYRRNADGILEIEPTEAEIVKMIFSDYLSGMGGLKIAKKLNEMDIRTAQGNLWTSPRIKELLSNEKYVGDMLLQKYFRNNHIEKRKMQNNGELPKYLVEDAHEAIIDRDTFQKVQELIAQRRLKFSHTGSKNRYPLSGMIQCGCCGKNYQRKVFKQGSAWICATFARRGKKYCPTAKQIPENILQSVLCEVLELEKYNDDAVLKYIRQIIVPEPNELIFIFHNGEQVQKHWENPSRSERWTEEMKQKAKEMSLQWHEKSQ